MTLTKRQQSFIGKEFTTPRGSKVSIVSVSNSAYTEKGWDGKYVLHCSLFSKDEELWPEGSITTRHLQFKI
jgi:hypothetical protein